MKKRNDRLSCLKTAAGVLERKKNSLATLEFKSQTQFTSLVTIKLSELTARCKYMELVIFNGLMEQCYQEKGTFMLLGRQK